MIKLLTITAMALFGIYVLNTVVVYLVAAALLIGFEM